VSGDEQWKGDATPVHHGIPEHEYYCKHIAELEAELSGKKSCLVVELELREQIAELREVLNLWEEHGSLSGNEECEGCRRAEFYRVTGILLPKEDKE